MRVSLTLLLQILMSILKLVLSLLEKHF